MITCEKCGHEFPWQDGDYAVCPNCLNGLCNEIELLALLNGVTT